MSDAITVILAIIAALGGAFWYGGKRGKAKIEAENLKRNEAAHKRAKEAEDEIGGLSDAATDEWLRRRAKR